MQQTNNSKARGFTLTELLVVIAVIMILSSLAVSALSRAKYLPSVTDCKNNYRQWGVACNLYANDNSQRAFPSFTIPASSGKNVWDVSLTMISAMQPYGLTVPMWFCPARPSNLDNATQTFQSRTGSSRAIANLDDLKVAVAYPGSDFGVIYHDVWIPRYEATGPSSLYPQVINPILGKPNVNANEIYQWPSKTTDATVTKAPILSDRVIGTSTNLAFAAEGHTVNGKVDSVNVLYGDGHVDLHKSSVIKWRWKGLFYTFY